MAGTRQTLLLAMTAIVVSRPAWSATPALCLAGVAWQGLAGDDASALRERLALALSSVGVEGAHTADGVWCSGISAETPGAQGQIFVQVMQSGATARVQLKVVDAATAATVYLRTVGCPSRDFPHGIDFETALESALLALHQSPELDG